MNESQIFKINQFLNDKLMQDTILGVFEDVFKQKSLDRDVQNLAARFQALELLERGVMELQKYKNSGAKEESGVKQVGL